MGTLGPNDFKNSNSDGHLYETQFLDQPGSYGETVSGGLDSIDTGILSFRASVNAVKSGSGVKQVIFSRYYQMNFYPDNDYGKKHTLRPRGRNRKSNIISDKISNRFRPCPTGVRETRNPRE